MQGILYRTNVPKLSVVAPTNNAKTIEKKKQYSIIGFLIMVRKNFLMPTFLSTNNVNNISVRLSKEESNVEIFFDSHKKGRYNVAAIAAGAIFARLVIEPSNSTPSEK